MAIDTKTEIYIGGEPILAYKSFTLSQDIGEHHDFELICRKDTLETVTNDEIVGESKRFLGELFLIEISPYEEFSEKEILQFKGIVTAVNTVKGYHLETGDIVKIIGKSCSVIADDGPHYTSHKDLDLSDIVKKTFNGYNLSFLKCKTALEKLETIHYSVQHNESAFEYIKRLAAQYGEWFYYDGKQLIFGQPQSEDTIPLLYGYDLLELSMSLRPVPNSFKYFTNDYLSDTHHEAKTREISNKIEGYNSFVSNKGANIYPKETQIFVPAHDDIMMESRMNSQVTKQKLANEIKQVKVTGITNNLNLKLGAIVSIQEDDYSHGSFRITKISHTSGENGNYQNTFEAVTAHSNTYPKTAIKSFPKGKAQTAVVVDNNDPDGMGRVQVQHAWQKNTGETTPWIRLSSTAGGSGQGFFFVPEIGDEVIVGHESDNAETPYVQGSMYNASSVPESFKSGNNHLKAIKTRSGNQVTLNDADGSVTIADPSGNTIIMGGNGEITINAPNKITFSSTDIAIEASNDVTVNAGNNITSTAATDISSKADASYKIDAGKDLIAKAGAKASINGGKSVTIFGKRVSITGTVMANIQSGAILTIITAGVLNLTGAATSLLNGAKVKVLGGKVNIN